MPGKFSKILCPLQFDQASSAALSLAKELAQQSDGTLYVLHVVSPHLDPTLVSGAAMPQHDEKVANERLAQLGTEQLAGVKYQALVRIGHPAHEIVKAEEEFGVDLVVMGTHGRSGLEHLVLGSVAEHVVRESNRPVLTIRPQ